MPEESLKGLRKVKMTKNRKIKGGYKKVYGGTLLDVLVFVDNKKGRVVVAFFSIIRHWILKGSFRSRGKN